MQKIQNKRTNGKMSGKTMAVVGASTLALGAAAYLLLGPNGKDNQKKLNKWMLTAKKEVVKKIKSAKDMSETAYEKIVDNVVTPYMKNVKINGKEAKDFATDLKKQWKMIKKIATPAVNKKISSVKKSVKKAVKKTMKNKK
jgi:polyhydroxyalkanoate synthesis regulator phasin